MTLAELLDAYRDAVAQAIINADILVTRQVALANEQQARTAIEAFVTKLAIQQNTEFWKNYADFQAKELRRSNDQLQKRLLELYNTGDLG